MEPSAHSSLTIARFFDQWHERLEGDATLSEAELAGEAGRFVWAQLDLTGLGIFQQENTQATASWSLLWGESAEGLSPDQLAQEAWEELKTHGQWVVAGEREVKAYVTFSPFQATGHLLMGVQGKGEAVARDLPFIRHLSRFLTRQSQALQARQAREAELTQLAAKARLLEEYARITAHNLRSPLFSMLGMVELIAEDARSGPVEEELLALLNSSSARLTRTLNDLDELIQPEGEQLALKLRVPLPPLLEQVMRSLNEEFPQVAPTLITDFSAGEEVEGISSLVESVLYNVMSLALRSWEQARPLRIELRTYQVEDRLVLQVKDNGQGLTLGPEGSLPLHPGAGSIQGSKGLGLRLVQGHMDTLRGAFAIESQPGQWTTLRLTFRQ